ncbi:hypothetical protein MASR2M8_17510 [Opitutaceae bacterium]
MPGAPLTTEAVVLNKRLPSDSYQSFTVFSPVEGVLLVLQRVSRKPSATHQTLDLFDEVSLGLETSNQGQTWFVKEARLLQRHGGIGRDYERLRLASAFASLVVRNPGNEEGRARVHALLRTGFSAFASSTRPDVVAFKCLYTFARDEGYPVRQHWLASLPASLHAIADRWLRTPLAELPASEPHPEEAQRLQPLLEHFLRSHTEILME